LDNLFIVIPLVTVYEVFDGDAPSKLELKMLTQKDFEQGFKFYHGEQYYDAQSLFETILQINQFDEVARIYRERCQEILSVKMPPSPVILIVDDSSFNLRLLFTLLSKHDFQIMAIQNSNQVLEIAKQQNPHLILLDVMMPDPDGFEVCKQLKADPQTSEIPVIFISALESASDKVKGFKLGAVDYITKPFYHEELLVRINTHLKLSYLQQQLKAKILGSKFFN